MEDAKTHKNPSKAPTLIILDTDIGSDIDDTWALVMLLNLSRGPDGLGEGPVDVKLITTCFADTTYRAKLVALALTSAQRTDIPIGIGIRGSPQKHKQPLEECVENYDFQRDYQGRVIEDGVRAIIDTIMQHKDTGVTLISIGPLTNIAAALERCPEIATYARFVGMQGSVYKGYLGSPKVVSEYNVRCDIPAALKVFNEHKWKEMVITPLDTCGLVRLTGKQYRQVREAAGSDASLAMLLDHYRIWFKNRNGTNPAIPKQPDDFWEKETSILFDTVAVFLGFRESFLTIHPLNLVVDEKGFMHVSPVGGSEKEDTEKETSEEKKGLSKGSTNVVRCAVDWKDMAGFKKYLVDVLCSQHQQ